ncbi:MAG: phosphatidate cytidylyltransferase [Firmicutes bacterium]|nr:phosphatidate cytidylyltransferase [Bacillota bacterium]
MKQRILVAVVGIPLLLAVLCWAPDWATALLLAALSVIAAHELLTAVCGAEKAKRWTALPAVTGALVIAAVYFSGEHYADSPAGTVLRWLIAAAVLALLLASVLTYGRPGALVLQDVCVMAVAGLVIPWAFSCMLQLRMLPHGAGMVLMPLVAAFCSDSAALFTGMACGRHKMAPLVSPHKTVEGALGGIAGGVVGMVIFRIVFYFCTLVPLHIGWCVVIGLAGALMGELGDLSFSVIKRQVGIKDYGRLLPGHGGVLDRFDSVLFAAPMIWMIVCTVQL